MRRKLLIAAFTALAFPCLGAPPWLGTYTWNNTGAESQYGNVSQTCELQLSLDPGGKVEISCEVYWQPGMDAGFGAEISQTGIVSTKKANGTFILILPFTFEDSTQNKGTGKITITRSTALLEVTTTQVNEPRAARQYGTYKLKKAHQDK